MLCAHAQGKTGYFQWRETLKVSHATTVTGLMQEAGYDAASQEQVKRFILKKDLKRDPENQVSYMEAPDNRLSVTWCDCGRKSGSS